MQETSASSEEITASVEEVDLNINELSGKAMEGSNNANQSKGRAIQVEEKGKRAIKEARLLPSNNESYEYIMTALEKSDAVFSFYRKIIKNNNLILDVTIR